MIRTKKKFPQCFVLTFINDYTIECYTITSIGQTYVKIYIDETLLVHCTAYILEPDRHSLAPICRLIYGLSYHSTIQVLKLTDRIIVLY